MATPDDLAAYDTRLEGLEAELARRQQLGSQYEQVLGRIAEINEMDETLREEHQVKMEIFLKLRTIQNNPQQMKGSSREWQKKMFMGNEKLFISNGIL